MVLWTKNASGSSSLGVADVSNPYDYNVVVLAAKFNSNGRFLFANEKYSSDSTISGSLTDVSLILFRFATSGSMYPFYGRTYSFKIWDNGNLVRNFVPCREKNGSMRVGLYDLVEGKLYPNDGSGSFTAGPDM